MTLHIRDATEADMAAVLRIYTPQVLHGLASFEETPPTLAEMLARRDSVLASGLAFLVAELNGAVMGYSYATLYRARPAYRHTIEDSVYVDEAARGHGVGSQLLSALIARAEAGIFRQMVAIIGNSANAGSIALHQRLGFDMVGTLRHVGYKHGQWLDTVIMQRALGTGAAAPP